MDVSVIFVNYNTAQLTLNAIQSVFDYTKNINFEIIVVDNDSKDDSVVLIEKFFPTVVIIKNKKNIGFGKANNKGFEIAKGKYCFLLNTDTYLINNAIEILFEYMENMENKNVAVVGAKLFKPDGSYCVSDARFPNYKLFVKGSFLKYFYRKSYYINEFYKPIISNDNLPYETDYVSGADFFVRKEVIDKIGGFNKSFFLYAEETELTYRIKKIIPSAKCLIIPKARIVHIGQSSRNKKFSNKYKYQFIKSRSIYYCLTKSKLSGYLYFIINLKRLCF